ncbi:GntR family transcriptional regulator [Caldicellulosiruptor changbaiensis]|uniref:GntR family transcriptional regulator n=1 Tax=Caldicellulosiruptor changbaiensis TaxID=1222016 RepID=A0A3T0D7F9_9FIRM|nr:GntR family transcriptional regulator [Caldicellulosiruptor changbaiensis]AZT90782.1 GntR family transcriptional regulator [Caldicellulosiruptor changbaiensis]
MESAESVVYPPRYELVLRKLKHLIEEKFKEGDKLPSEVELAKFFGVSRATLREAMRILEEEGYVIRKHGIGTFVASRPILQTGMEELQSITKLMEKQGYQPHTKDVIITRTYPNAKEAHMLKINQNEEIIKIERVRLADNIPVVYCIDRLPAKLFGEKFEFKGESLFDYLNDNLGIYIAYAVSDIIPMLAEKNGVYKKLELEKNDVVLLLDQIHFDQSDTPILYSSNFFSPKKFRFYIVRKRV